MQLLDLEEHWNEEDEEFAAALGMQREVRWNSFLASCEISKKDGTESVPFVREKR